MKEQNQKKSISLGTGLVIGIAAIYILFGLAMVFIPQFKEVYIIYLAGAILVIYGIILIVRYFLNGSYRDIGKYGFSGGVLSVLSGICMLVRSDEISPYFSLFLGICILLTAVIKLQNAVDLKGLGNQAWFVFLIIAVLFLAAAIAIVLDPMGKMSANKDYIYYVLIADGAVNIISTLYLAIAIRTSRKKAKKEQDKQQSDTKKNRDHTTKNLEEAGEREIREEIPKAETKMSQDILAEPTDEALEDILQAVDDSK